MVEILVIGSRSAFWDGVFASAFPVPHQLYHVDSVSQGLDIVRQKPPRLVVLDSFGEEQALPQDTKMEAIRKVLIDIMMSNASVLTAVCTPLEEEAFHEAAEGLGVLAQLSLEPVCKEIADLYNKMKLVGAV